MSLKRRRDDTEDSLQHSTLLFMADSRNISIGKAMGYGGGRPRDKSLFPTPQSPDRFWGPPSLLYNRFQGLLPRT
jgi:hypothetical protein